jgi:hypothetical protein
VISTCATILVRRSFLLLSCDWRFLPKLGPHPHRGAAFFRVTAIIRSGQQFFADVAQLPVHFVHGQRA